MGTTIRRLATGLTVGAALLMSTMAGRSRAGEVDMNELHLRARLLRCEYLVNPLGLDEKEPRLSWIVESSQRGQKQTAYQVLVASDAAALQQDRGELWDSGKVESDETTAIVYAGKPLVSHQYCYWKVKAWDKDGIASEWSEPAHWSMGPLSANEWKGRWIGYDKPREQPLPNAPFDGAKWIWFSGDKGKKDIKGPRLFITKLTLPTDIQVESAKLLITSNDKYWFHIGGKLLAFGTAGAGNWRKARLVDVTAMVKPGANEIRVGVEPPVQDAAGLILKLDVTASKGQQYMLVSDANWKATAQLGDNWHNRPLDTSKFPASEVLGDYGAAPWGKIPFADLILPPPVYLRTGFQVTKPVQRATLYGTALGIFDLHLNGKRVSEDRFNPGWTDYTKRVYYRAYDVTNLLHQGDNALGAILADGWYSGYIGWNHIRDHYGKHSRFRGQLHIVYADGSTADVATGPSWKASTGPIREADFLMGEIYDARLDTAGWDTPSFDDGKWEEVATGAELHPLIQHHPGPPVRPCGEFRPKSITEPRKGVYVLDLGQNFAGVVRLAVSGEPGQQITLRFAERLRPDGMIYTTNLRGARATDRYICRGSGVEVWEPRFTFHGFQYVEITGLRTPPTRDTVTGVALSSDTPVVGAFHCSDPMLNRLHGNVYWTQRANFIDIPTDCPQRDERLGWTGDAQVYVRTATLNCDVQAFFTKWLVDLDDGQRADGQYPMVAPVKVAGPDGGPAWADAGVICPWTIYEVYGDRRLLERHYPAMRRFIEFCRAHSTPELLPPKEFHCFGDWLSINADTPKDVIYTAYFAHSTDLLARAAVALGHTDDAARYRDLFTRLKAAFNQAYVAPDGRIKGNTQTCYALALAYDLLDADRQQQAARYLVADLEQRGGHLSTGFVGTKDLMPVLSKVGRAEVAYRLLGNETFPSWGFSIKHGATSIWERWDGWTPENGFQDPGMNSFAHYSFGAVYQWMVENIAGIRSEGPGYKRIVIAPRPGSHLQSAQTMYRSIQGPIETAWEQKDGQFSLRVTIPANTTATVCLPAAPRAEITESGRALDEGKSGRLMRREADQAVLAIGSGTYRFSVQMRAR
jgi:alpha-L-rhamnosidase